MLLDGLPSALILDTMSEGEAIPVQAAVVAPKASIPILPLIAAVIASVVLATAAIGGGMWWAVKTNHLPLAGVKQVEVVAAPDPPKTKMVSLEPLLVNLADPDGRSYLRISLTLKLDEPAEPKGAKPKEEAAAKGGAKNEFEAEERDASLEILGKETSASLLEPDGKEKLKKDLMEAFRDRVPEVKVVDVLITEFLVQR
jgi:flagellar FliL protein